VVSQENTEVALRAVSALNRGDIPGLLDEYDEDIEIVLAESAIPEPGTHRGRAAAEALLSDIWATIENFKADVSEMREVGERMLFLVHFYGRGAGSGVDVRQEFSWLYSFSANKISRLEIYGSWDEGLAAAGLRE
jgi:ketosteroid isomerase-like protein